MLVSFGIKLLVNELSPALAGTRRAGEKSHLRVYTRDMFL